MKHCSQLDQLGHEQWRTIHVKLKALDIPAFSKVCPLEQSFLGDKHWSHKNGKLPHFVNFLEIYNAH